MPPLTERLLAAVDFICACPDRRKSPPGIPEIAYHFGIKSPNGVSWHVHDQ